MSASLGTPLGKALALLFAALCAALPAAANPPGGSAVVPRANAPATPKAYSVGGALALRDDVAYQFDSTVGPVRLDVGRVTNESATTTSGSVRVGLFVTQSPSPTTAGTTIFTIARTDLGVLQPGFFFGPLSHTVPYITPPDGTYYIHMGVFEYEPGVCNANDGYCLDDLVSFVNRVQVINGQVFDVGPAPENIDVAIEYYHQGFNHYFATSFDNEIALLDNGTIAGWRRTGRSFNVWTTVAPDRPAVCRFFSAVFAPRSSHFYTHTECAIVLRDPVWTFEGNVFAFEFAGLDGSCLPGRQALYRLYNEGMSSAPNHRYTTSFSVRNDMVAAGWTSEGYGALGVFACVPL